MSKVLALLVRALRTESRDIKSHLFRFGLAAIIVLILMVGASAVQYATAPGRGIFNAMIVANWAIVTLAAGTFFSIAISEETEQQTLGLLRMANVSPLALLLGKWLPRLMAAVVLILVQFPFTWLTVTLGGVNWQQIWASYLMLLAHLFLVGNLGLLSSVLRPNSASACAMTFTIMVLSKLLPWLCYGLLDWLGAMNLIPGTFGTDFYQNILDPLSQCSASGRLFGEILATSFKGSAWSMQVITNFGLGAFLFGAAWLLFDQITMQHMSGAPGRRIVPRQLSRMFQKNRRQSARAWDWAIGWKDFRQIAGGMRWLTIKFFLYGALFLLVLIIGISQMNGYRGLDDCLEMTCAVVAWMSLVILLLELSFTAAKLFRPELNDHTWSTLLTLPKTVPEISYSKLGGAALGLIPSVTVLCLTATPFLGEILHEISREGEILIVIGYVISLVIVSLHLITHYSIAVTWAAWPIAVILGVGTVVIAHLVCWFMFIMMMIGPRGSSGDSIGWAYVGLLTIGNLVVSYLVHVGIGQRLQAKGAES